MARLSPCSGSVSTAAASVRVAWSLQPAKPPIRRDRSQRPARQRPTPGGEAPSNEQQHQHDDQHSQCRCRISQSSHAWKRARLDRLRPDRRPTESRRARRAAAPESTRPVVDCHRPVAIVERRALRAGSAARACPPGRARRRKGALNTGARRRLSRNCWRMVVGLPSTLACTGGGDGQQLRRRERGEELRRVARARPA